jgi:hypothetical protein
MPAHVTDMLRGMEDWKLTGDTSLAIDVGEVAWI